MRNEYHELNEAAFRTMEDSIRATYPAGRLIAFAEGRLVADAANFDELHALLKSQGRDPYQALVVEAGRKYPKHAIIF